MPWRATSARPYVVADEREPLALPRLLVPHQIVRPCRHCSPRDQRTLQLDDLTRRATSSRREREQYLPGERGRSLSAYEEAPGFRLGPRQYLAGPTRLTSTISPYWLKTASRSPSVRSKARPPAKTYAECLNLACHDASSLRPSDIYMRGYGERVRGDQRRGIDDARRHPRSRGASEVGEDRRCGNTLRGERAGAAAGGRVREG